VILETLARRRVPLGFVVGALAMLLARPTGRTLIAGGLIAVAGEALRVWAAGHLEKGREVTMTGPYRLTRHPLYVGSTLIGVGLVVASANWWVTALILAYLGATLTAAIRTEEAHLTEKFGAAYPDYRGGRSSEGRRHFSIYRAMRNREHRAAIGVVLGLAVLAWKAGQVAGFGR
jgi:protein-S-isoprenylcysteine O-methyltransferase Ste14